MSAEISVTIRCNACGVERREPIAGENSVVRRVRERIATQGWLHEGCTRGPVSLRKDYCPPCRRRMLREMKADETSGRTP